MCRIDAIEMSKISVCISFHEINHKRIPMCSLGKPIVAFYNRYCLIFRSSLTETFSSTVEIETNKKEISWRHYQYSDFHANTKFEHAGIYLCSETSKLIIAHNNLKIISKEQDSIFLCRTLPTVNSLTFDGTTLQ